MAARALSAAACCLLSASLSEALLGTRSLEAGSEPPDGEQIAAHLRESARRALATSGLVRALEPGLTPDQSLDIVRSRVVELSKRDAAAVALDRSTAKTDSSHGVHYQRSNAKRHEGSSLVVNISSGCTSEDAFGSNNCTLMPGQTGHVKLTYRLGEELGPNATFAMNFSTRLIGLSAVLHSEVTREKMHGFRKYLPPVNVTCPVCGAMCDVEVMSNKATLKMPACPLPVGVDQVLLDLDFRVPKLAGLKAIQSHMSSSMAIRRDDGTPIAQTDSFIKVGKLADPDCPEIKRVTGKCN